MPTPDERRALLFVAIVAALGSAVRGVVALRGSEVPVSDRSALADQIARVDSAITQGGKRPARARAVVPKAPSDPVDLDRADSAALDGLPGIGPALASRIVADRAANGPFGSLEALQRVKGVGPALAARLAPVVTFSAVGRRSPMVPESATPTAAPASTPTSVPARAVPRAIRP